jgi:histidine ammonia-lyase
MNHTLGKEPLSCKRVVQLATSDRRRIAIDAAALDRVRAGRAAVDHLVDNAIAAYGVTTGVGSQKSHPVEPGELDEYNLRLIRGHATRVPGPSVQPQVVRAALIIIAQQFSSGTAGVSPHLLDVLCEAIALQDMPNVDAAGSVGASDLVPLSQIADWLLGLPSAAGLPGPKEALALINSNAISLATGAFQIHAVHRLLDTMDMAAALTMEGFRANLDAVSEPVNSVHERTGQAAAAARLRDLLAGSTLWNDGEARLLQDPLSFRNVSQIHGAAREFTDWLTDVWNVELNAVTVNPLVNVGPKVVYSHGNMDSTRMTLALDGCRQALAKVVDVAGERIQKIQWPSFSGLPIGLAAEDDPIGGVQFLNLGHIAASLITSVKIWAQPHLLHSIGQLADGVEDTASHALHAVHDLERQLEACNLIVAIETTIAVWAILRRGIAAEQLGVGLRHVVDAIGPLLPMGTEGLQVFDLETVVDCLRELQQAQATLADAATTKVLV